MSKDKTPTRIPWIDYLRTLVIVLVVNLHCCVTYSHVGDWYVKNDAEPSRATFIGFLLWEAHLQAFFMGLLFLLAGYFSWISLNRRGSEGFLRERALRLGLPAIFYMLLIHPFILFVINPWNARFPPFLSWYRDYIFRFTFLKSTGPLWFLVALLLFSLGLVAVTRSARHSTGTAAPPNSEPRVTTVLCLALSLGLMTFAVRLIQPIGTSILNMQLCFFTQYIAAFAIGAKLASSNGLEAVASSRLARRTGIITLVVGPVAAVLLLLAGSSGGVPPYLGGWHWQAFGYALWEQFTAVGLSLGLMHLFRAKLNHESHALRWLSDRSFAVYVLHAPVIIALFCLFKPLKWPPLPMTVLLTVTGLGATYLLAEIFRRVPGVRRVL